MSKLRIAYAVYSVVGSALLGAWAAREFGRLNERIDGEVDAMDEVLIKLSELDKVAA